MKTRYFALLALALFGCMTSKAVAPNQLARLDGFDAAHAVGGDEPVVSALDGSAVKVRANTTFHLGLANGELSGAFDRIRVQDGTFEGTIKDGQTVTVRLDELRRAEVDQVDYKLTGVVVAGTVLALVAGLVFVYAKSSAPMVSEGRALRLRGRVVAAPLVAAEGDAASWRAPRVGPARVGPQTSALSETARTALAVIWTERARTEHASVPAFARLSLTLTAFGGPASLIEAAHVAAREEIDHARLAFGLASAYADRDVAPGPLTELHGAPAMTVSTLRQLAEESLVDGVLMEGAAAAAAAAELLTAEDAAVREALQIITRDEASHAELAWNIVEWCVERDEAPAELLVSLRRLVLRTPAPKSSMTAWHTHALAAELSAHGCLAPATWCHLFETTRSEAAARLEQLA